MERIQTHPIDITMLLDGQNFPQCGGLAIFCGTVRNQHLGKSVISLKYTAYKPLAEKMIRTIEADIQQHYGIPCVRAVHRIGHLDIGDTAIVVVARAVHRREAFTACEAAVERIKHEVPIWKEEFYSDGSSAFVEGCCIRRDEQHAHHHPSFPHTRESDNQPELRL